MRRRWHSWVAGHREHRLADGKGAGERVAYKGEANSGRECVARGGRSHAILGRQFLRSTPFGEGRRAPGDRIGQNSGDNPLP